MAKQAQTRLRLLLDVLEMETSIGANNENSSLRHLIDRDISVANGTSANQADMVWSTQQTVTNGAPDDHDLAGSLASVLHGDTLTFVEIIGIAVRNHSTTASENIQIGAGSNPVSSPWLAAGDGAVIGPEGLFLWWSPSDGGAVTAGTADILRIAASTGTITYSLIVVGRTA